MVKLIITIAYLFMGAPANLPPDVLYSTQTFTVEQCVATVKSTVAAMNGEAPDTEWSTPLKAYLDDFIAENDDTADDAEIEIGCVDQDGKSVIP